jgi:hypothetical protein
MGLPLVGRHPARRRVSGVSCKGLQDVHGESEVALALIVALAALFNEVEGRAEDCELEEPTLEGRRGTSWGRAENY